MASGSELIEQALRAFDPEPFVRRHGGYKEGVNPQGREWLLTCPDCGSSRLRWRHDPPRKMAWICWGCRRTGDTIDLVALLESIDRSAALQWILTGYHGGDAPTELTQYAQITAPVRMELSRLPPIGYPPGFEAIDFRAPAHAPARAYLFGVRGLQPQDVIDYRLGYVREGKLKGYVVFPVWQDGGLVYWQARATWDPPQVSDDQRKAWIKATGYRKTLNPPGVSKARGVIFNHDRASVEPHVVICEGPIDAMKVGPHAVALLGKEPNPTQVERLLRMGAQRYTVYLDPGEEERRSAMKLAAQLDDFAPTYLATPPLGSDPGDLSREGNATQIAQATPYKPLGLQSNLKI